MVRINRIWVSNGNVGKMLRRNGLRIMVDCWDLDEEEWSCFVKILESKTWNLFLLGYRNLRIFEFKSEMVKYKGIKFIFASNNIQPFDRNYSKI